MAVSTSAAASRRAVAMVARAASSGCRRSTVKSTRPGMTLRELGCTRRSPTVPTPWGACARAACCTAVTICGAAQGVAPPRHGGGAGVRFHALDRAVKPALSLQPLHHADDALVGLQQRPLLDMRLEEGVHRLAAAGPLAGVADVEKAQLLRWVVQDLGEALPGVENRPEVCGGEACIVRTRIPVWLLVQARRLGTSDVDILRSYPTLRAEELANAWPMPARTPRKFDQQIRDNEAA